MYCNGIIIPDWVRYLKLVQDSEVNIITSDSNKSLEIHGMYSDEIDGIDSIDHQELGLFMEFIKVPTSLPSITFPGFKLTKRCIEDFEVNIIVVKLDDTTDQFEDTVDESSEHEQSISNTVHSSYSRLTILLREDRRSVADLAKLLKDNPYVDIEVLDENAEVGSKLTLVLRNKDIVVDAYYSMDPFDYNGNISVLDWSHAMKGLLDVIKDQVSIYDFNNPVTSTEQELPTNANLIKYNFSELQQGNVRGHLIGGHWNYFYMHKMPFSLEFLLTSTDYYVRLLHEMQLFRRITNIGEFWVTANDGVRWKVAVEWVFPIGNDFDLNDPKGSSATVGNSIKLDGFLHFNTIAKDEFKWKITQLLMGINSESDNINSLS